MLLFLVNINWRQLSTPTAEGSFVQDWSEMTSNSDPTLRGSTGCGICNLLRRQAQFPRFASWRRLTQWAVNIATDEFLLSLTSRLFALDHWSVNHVPRQFDFLAHNVVKWASSCKFVGPIKVSLLPIMGHSFSVKICGEPSSSFYWLPPVNCTRRVNLSSKILMIGI